MFVFYHALCLVFFSFKLSNCRDKSGRNHDSSYECPNVSIFLGSTVLGVSCRLCEIHLCVISDSATLQFLFTITCLFHSLSFTYIWSTLSILCGSLIKLRSFTNSKPGCPIDNDMHFPLPVYVFLDTKLSALASALNAYRIAKG